MEKSRDRNKEKKSLTNRRSDKDRRSETGNRTGMYSNMSEGKKGTINKILNVLDNEGRQRMPDGKRKHARKPLYNIVDYATRDGFHKDFLKDLSVGGVFIETNFAFSIGQGVLLTFPLLKAQKQIKINGEIVRINKDGIGVKFGKTNEEQETMLISFLDTL